MLILCMAKSIGSITSGSDHNFFGFYERFLFLKCRKPHVYLRYVNDTFFNFNSFTNATAFHSQLNSFHSNLQITMQVENDCNFCFWTFLLSLNMVCLLTVFFANLRSPVCKLTGILSLVSPVNLT